MFDKLTFINFIVANFSFFLPHNEFSDAMLTAAKCSIIKQILEGADNGDDNSYQ